MSQKNKEYYQQNKKKLSQKQKLYKDQNKENISTKENIQRTKKEKLSKPKIKIFEENAQDVVQNNTEEFEQDEIQAEMPVPYE